MSGSVLVVEDNPDLADNLVEIVGSAGYAVGCARTCAEARSAGLDAFDVALVDVRLPDGDGIELAPILKAQAPEGEIILLTGFATLESAIGAVRAGAWAYLVKPCPPADLLIAVGQAMRQVALQKEKRELARRTLLAEKLAALGTMAAGLAHEIRNPLNAAQLHLGLAERRLRGGTPEGAVQSLESLAIVRSEMERLNALVEDVLAFARPSDLRLADGDLAKTVESILGFLAPDIEASGVVVHLSGVERALGARYDDARVRQVVMNLVRNAVEAAGVGGEVWISVDRHGSFVEVRVEDSGPGVPADVDPFVPFFTTKPRGTGLGLPTAHRILAEHGGTLSLDRNAPRTAFVALLPAR